MEWMTSWQKKGFEQGLQQGLQLGEERGKRKIVLRQLPLCVGALSKQLQTTIERLPIRQLEQLGEALLNFNSRQDLTRWLQEHAAVNGQTNGHKAKK